MFVRFIQRLGHFVCFAKCCLSCRCSLDVHSSFTECCWTPCSSWVALSSSSCLPCGGAGKCQWAWPRCCVEAFHRWSACVLHNSQTSSGKETLGPLRCSATRSFPLPVERTPKTSFCLIEMNNIIQNNRINNVEIDASKHISLSTLTDKKCCPTGVEERKVYWFSSTRGLHRVKRSLLSDLCLFNILLIFYGIQDRGCRINVVLKIH